MNTIETKNDLQTALALSYDRRIALFKLSNRCPISESFYERLARMTLKEVDVADRIYLLVVQDARSLSNEIAQKFGVIHETPQILIIENEDIVYYESHEKIDLDKVPVLLRNSS